MTNKTNNISDKLEKLNFKEIDETELFLPALPFSKFNNATPNLGKVIITEKFGVYDGVTSGICKIRGHQFYFCTLIESCWRYYDRQYKQLTYNNKKQQYSERLWRIFAVYTMDDEFIEKLNKIKNIENTNQRWSELRDLSDIAINADPIGIFWDYKYELENTK